MSALQRNKHFLMLLLKTTEKQALNLLKTSSPQQIQLVCEIALNTLHGQFLKSRKLSLFKALVRSLANKGIPMIRKKNIISRKTKYILAWLKVIEKSLIIFFRMSRKKVVLSFDRHQRMLKHAEDNS